MILTGAGHLISITLVLTNWSRISNFALYTTYKVKYISWFHSNKYSEPLDFESFIRLSDIKMAMNPWMVENIHVFSFLNCPECTFKTKFEDLFEKHAVGNHPLSCMLFKESTRIISLMYLFHQVNI